MSLSLADGIAEQLKCPVCLEEYRKPKLLRCYHSYCQDCVKRLLKRSEDKNIVKCPQCRTKMEVPDGNVEGLESNFFINNILDILEKNRKKQTCVENSVICVQCELRGEAGTAIACDTCQMPLCDSCFQIHKHKETFKFKKATGSMSATKVPVCIEHDKERTFYCQDCKELFCKECIQQYHKKDDYIEVKKALKTHRRVIDWLLVRCKVKLLNVSEEIKRVQIMDEIIAKNASDTKTSIDEHFRKLSEALEKKQAELKDVVNSLENEKMKQLSFQKENLSMTLSSLATGIEFTEEAMKEGNEKELLSLRNKICDRLEELSETKVEKCSEVWWDFYLHSPFDTNALLDDASLLGEFRIQNDTVRATVSFVGGEEGVLYNTFVNQSCKLVITLKYKDGTQVKTGGQNVQVSIRIPPRNDDFRSGSISSIVQEYEEPRHQESINKRGLYENIEVIDNNDGTHSFEYKPKQQGDYYIQVTVNAKPLAGDLKWTVESSLGFGDLANEMGCAVLQPPYGMAPSWKHSVAGGKHCWKIKRVSYDEYAVVRVGVMMDFTSDKWGWCNGRREEPDPTFFSLPDHHPSNIPMWNEGEVFVFYSNEETGTFIIRNETTQLSDLFQRCPGTVVRPYVFPASYTSFSMNPKFEKKLIKIQAGNHK